MVAKNFVEMEETGKMNWCCGGGGGCPPSRRRKACACSLQRKKAQLDELNVDRIVTACANCRITFEEGSTLPHGHPGGWPHRNDRRASGGRQREKRSVRAGISNDRNSRTLAGLSVARQRAAAPSPQRLPCASDPVIRAVSGRRLDITEAERRPTTRPRGLPPWRATPSAAWRATGCVRPAIAAEAAATLKPAAREEARLGGRHTPAWPATVSHRRRGRP
jgi:hypothetical protein